MTYDHQHVFVGPIMQLFGGSLGTTQLDGGQHDAARKARQEGTGGIMNRRNRTLIVLLVAVGLASVATYFVYRAITRIPVRQVEVASCTWRSPPRTCRWARG